MENQQDSPINSSMNFPINETDISIKIENNPINPVDEIELEEELPSASLSIQIQRTRKNFKTCIICNSSMNKLHRISQSAITDAFVRTNILIPEGSRCCSEHFEEFNRHFRLKSSDIALIQIHDESINLKSESISQM